MMCPVCGFAYLRDDAINHGICPSCGTEFGYDDASISHEILRFEWLRSGATWFDNSVAPPKHWNAWEQVLGAFYRPSIQSVPPRKSAGNDCWANVSIRGDTGATIRFIA